MKIGIRMYNVGFGDCFLVTFYEANRQFRMLIDCGRLSGSRTPAKGGPDFQQVVGQLIRDINDGSGAKLDVIVMTHRHRDHIHGFSNGDQWDEVAVKEVWMPWVENPNDPTASGIVAAQERQSLTALFAMRALRAKGDDPAADEAIEIAYNCTTNNAAMSTLRGFAGARIRYLPDLGRDPQTLTSAELNKVLPDGVKVHVLGPSRDPRVIKRLDPPEDKVYKRLLPLDPTVGDDAPELDRIETAPWPFETSWITDAGSYGLDDKEAAGIRKALSDANSSPLELTYRLDNAINGTSLVMVIEAAGHKLLFSGDAQWGTWEAIFANPGAKAILDGITVFKVGHHGSHNATPRELIEGGYLDSTEQALISVDSTSNGAGWEFIPLPSLVAAIQEKVKVVVQSNAMGNASVTAPKPGETYEVMLG